jgi:hypothetical protein
MFISTPIAVYGDGMGLRQRKNTLLTVLKAHEVGKELTSEQVETFRLMYARARTEEEQDQVTAVVHQAIDGWKTGTDRMSKILQNIEDDPEDEDPPSLKAVIAKFGVRVG